MGAHLLDCGIEDAIDPFDLLPHRPTKDGRRDVDDPRRRCADLHVLDTCQLARHPDKGGEALVGERSGLHRLPVAEFMLGGDTGADQRGELRVGMDAVVAELASQLLDGSEADPTPLRRDQGALHLSRGSFER